MLEPFVTDYHFFDPTSCHTLTFKITWRQSVIIVE